MKKIIVIIALVTLNSSIFAPATSAKADNDKPVRFEQLPDAARKFIHEHFADAKLTLATVDKEVFETTYDVIFTDGTQIEFNSRGEWKDIECRGRFVPEKVMMTEIVDFLRQQHPDARVKEIERNKNGFEINLDNRMELAFDTRGNFRGYDD